MTKDFPALKHDPATCTRRPCRRCDGPHQASPPPARSNPHNTAMPSRPRLPKNLDPVSIAIALEAAAKALRTTGIEAWQRLHDWQPIPRIPAYPGDENTGRPERSAEDDRNRRENAQAARYWNELATTAPRIYADAHRMSRLVDIARMPNRKGSISNLQGCELCTTAGLKSDGKPIPFDHHSNVGERLERDTFLCQAHYLYVHRHGYAPSTEQTRHWHTTGTWKVKATK